MFSTVSAAALVYKYYVYRHPSADNIMPKNNNNRHKIKLYIKLFSFVIFCIAMACCSHLQR